MQGFAGLILFSVFVLMALGLAIIFGQMGVINMAHGEFMILGAYVPILTSHLFHAYLPGAVQRLLLRRDGPRLLRLRRARHAGRMGADPPPLRRPLDTLLATWGLSLILQQAYRSIFGAREVGVELPEWMMGASTSPNHPDPDQRHVRHGLTILIRSVVYLLIFRSRWGHHVRAVMQNRAMAGAIGIDTEARRPLTFGLGCGIAGVAGSAFTMIGSTCPTAGPALHRRHLPRRRVRRRAKPARHDRVGLHDLPGPIDPGILPLRLDGQGHRAARRGRHPDAAAARPVRPQGPPVT